MTNLARLLPAPLLLSLALLAGCDAQAAGAPPPPAPPDVAVVRARAQDAPDVLSTSGRIEAVHDVDLRPRVSGPIVRVAYREGSRVRAGTPLFELDPRPFAARRDRALAERARAVAALALARDELTRARSLHERSVLEAAEVERRAAELEMRAAEKAGADAAVAAAALELEFATVRAPVDGVVGRALATEGDHVEAGATSLGTLVSLDPIRVRFVVDEATYQRLRGLEGSSLRVRVGVSDDGPPVDGVVDTLDNRVDPATGSAFVRATLPNPDGRLSAGLFARVDLLLPASEPRVLVPETALAVARGQRLVWVVGDDGRLDPRSVTLGPRLGGLRAIAGGLRAGERVAVGNLAFLRPGVRVNPVERAAELTSTAPSQEAP